MLLTGIAFFITWLEVQVFNLDIVRSILVTALIFIILGVLVEYGPTLRTRIVK